MSRDRHVWRALVASQKPRAFPVNSYELRNYSYSALNKNKVEDLFYECAMPRIYLFKQVPILQ